MANKNILYFATNAVVAIAYTGFAYLEGIPMDYWISEKLAGITVDPENPRAMYFGKERYWRDIGLSLRVLTTELNKQKHVLKNRRDLFLVVHGWQWNSKGRLRPLVGCIGKTRQNNKFGIHYEPRDWYLKGETQTIVAPRGFILREELSEFVKHLSGKSAHEVEGLLVDKVREVSRRCSLEGRSVVGPYCISILLPPPSNPIISVRYYSATSSAIPESQRLAEDQIVWAYSPWILSPRVCMPPSQIAGAPTYRIGPFTVCFEAEESSHPDYIFAITGHKRRKK